MMIYFNFLRQIVNVYLLCDLPGDLIKRELTKKILKEIIVPQA